MLFYRQKVKFCCWLRQTPFGMFTFIFHTSRSQQTTHHLSTEWIKTKTSYNLSQYTLIFCWYNYSILLKPVKWTKPGSNLSGFKEKFSELSIATFPLPAHPLLEKPQETNKQKKPRKPSQNNKNPFQIILFSKTSFLQYWENIFLKQIPCLEYFHGRKRGTSPVHHNAFTFWNGD